PRLRRAEGRSTPRPRPPAPCATVPSPALDAGGSRRAASRTPPSCSFAPPQPGFPISPSRRSTDRAGSSASRCILHAWLPCDLLDPRRKNVRCNITPLRSDRDARSQLDNPLRQQIEVFRGSGAVSLHPAEQLPAPRKQTGPGRPRDGRFAEEECCPHRVERESVAGQ